MVKADGVGQLKGVREAELQMAVIALRDRYKAQYPVLHLLNGSANGEKREKRQNPHTGAWYSPDGQKLQRMGVTPGWPDLELPVSRKGYTGLFIEMKRPGGRPEPEQNAIHNLLLREGALVYTCTSWWMAWRLIVGYLGLPVELLEGVPEQ